MSHRLDARTSVQAGTSSASGLLDLLGVKLLLCRLWVPCLTYFPVCPLCFLQSCLDLQAALSWGPHLFGGGPDLCSLAGWRRRLIRWTPGRICPERAGEHSQGLYIVIPGLSGSPGRQWLHLTDPLNSCNREKAAPSLPPEPSPKRRGSGRTAGSG